MKVSFKSITDALKGVKPSNAESGTIVNAIADALTPAFDAQAEAIETALNLEIENHTKAVTDSVTKSVTDAVTLSFEARMKKLEDDNAQLQKDVENGLGAESKAKDENETKPKMKGTFGKSVGTM